MHPGIGERPMHFLSRLAGRLDAHDGPTPDLDLSLALQAAHAPPRSAELSEMVREAWEMGQAMALDGIGYGPAHWKGEGFHADPLPYYYFLAGLAHTQGCRRICEVGTHYGGSCLSMLRGAGPEAEILTVDISDINPAIAKTTGVTKLTGDANCAAIIKTAVLHFGGQPIDLLYVDADHRFTPTLTSLGLYCLLLRPRLVVVDDVALNPQMRTLWSVLTAAYGASTANCTDIVCDIRDRAVGFGLLKLR
jgi:hypothetical protein